MALFRSSEWAAAIDGLRSGLAKMPDSTTDPIDPSVLAAIDFAHAENLSDLSDLRPYVHRVYGDLDLDSGLFHRLQGYIGEQVAADQLESLGHDVDFAPFSNQPGWDLLIDGEPFNIKTVSDASSIYEHFQTYPHIPVVAPSNIAENAADAGYDVVGLDELDIGEIRARMASTITALTDSGDSGVEELAEALSSGADLGFPVITAFTSAAREARLLWRGDTNVANAAKNMGFDILGTQSGVMLASALVGGAAWPVVIGVTVASAIAGRRLTRWWKRQPMVQRRKKLLAMLESHQSLLVRANADIQARVRRTLKREEARLSDVQERASVRQDAAAASLLAATIDVALSARRVFQADVDAITMYTRAHQRRYSGITGRLRSLLWWIKKRDHWLLERLAVRESQISEHAKLVTRVVAQESDPKSSAEVLHNVLSTAVSSQLGRAHQLGALRDLEAASKQAKHDTAQIKTDIREAWAESARKVKDEGAALYLEYAPEISRAESEMGVACQALHEELRKLDLGPANERQPSVSSSLFRPASVALRGLFSRLRPQAVSVHAPSGSNGCLIGWTITPLRRILCR